MIFLIAFLRQFLKFRKIENVFLFQDFDQSVKKYINIIPAVVGRRPSRMGCLTTWSLPGDN